MAKKINQKWKNIQPHINTKKRMFLESRLCRNETFSSTLAGVTSNTQNPLKEKEEEPKSLLEMANRARKAEEKEEEAKKEAQKERSKLARKIEKKKIQDVKKVKVKEKAEKKVNHSNTNPLKNFLKEKQNKKPLEFSPVTSVQSTINENLEAVPEAYHLCQKDVSNNSLNNNNDKRFKEARKQFNKAEKEVKRYAGNVRKEVKSYASNERKKVKKESKLRYGNVGVIDQDQYKKTMRSIGEINDNIAIESCAKSAGMSNNKFVEKAIGKGKTKDEAIEKAREVYVKQGKKNLKGYKEKIKKTKSNIENAKKRIKILSSVDISKLSPAQRVELVKNEKVLLASQSSIKSLRKAKREEQYIINNLKKSDNAVINRLILQKIPADKIVKIGVENIRKINAERINPKNETELLKEIENFKKTVYHNRIEYRKRHISPKKQMEIEAEVRYKKMTSKRKLSQEELDIFQKEITQNIIFDSLSREEQNFILSASYIEDIKKIEKEKEPLYEREYKKLYKTLNEKEKGTLINILDLKNSNNESDKKLLEEFKNIQNVAGTNVKFYRKRNENGDNEEEIYANIHGIKVQIPTTSNGQFSIHLPNGENKQFATFQEAEPIIENILAHQVFQVLHIDKFFKGQEEYEGSIIQMCLNGGKNPMLGSSEKIEKNNNENKIIFDPLTALRKTAYYLSALGANFTPTKSNISKKTRNITNTSGNSLSEEGISNLQNIGFLGKDKKFSPTTMQQSQQLISFISQELEDPKTITNQQTLIAHIKDYDQRKNSSFLHKISPDENNEGNTNLYAINMSSKKGNKQVFSIENEHIKMV